MSMLERRLNNISPAQRLSLETVVAFLFLFLFFSFLLILFSLFFNKGGRGRKSYHYYLLTHPGNIYALNKLAIHIIIFLFHS